MKLLDPRSIRPPHGVCNNLRFIFLFRRFQSNGWEGRPLVVIRLRNSKRWKYYSITGSHRIAAARKAGIKVPVIVLPSSFYDYLKSNYLVGNGSVHYCDVYDDAWRFVKGLKTILNWNRYKLAAQVLSEENSTDRNNWLFKNLKTMIVGVKQLTNTNEYGVRYKLLLTGGSFVIVYGCVFRKAFPFIKKHCKGIKYEG